MFKVSKMADYATLIMVQFARHSNDCHNAKMIAEQLQLTVPTISKLLKLLSNASLLTSQRGAKGGYSLARPAMRIAITEILQAVDGELAITECSQNHSDCALESHCSTMVHWQYINKAISETLAHITLADIATPKPPLAKVSINSIKTLNHRPTL